MARRIRKRGDIVFTLAAGERRTEYRAGRAYYCISVTTDAVVKIGMSQEPDEFLYSAMGDEIGADEEYFETLEFLNTSGAPQTVVLKTTFGNVFDNRLSLVGGTIPAQVTNFAGTSLDDVADVAIGAAATQIVAANANRRAVIIQNLSAGSNFRVGGNTPGPTRGYRLAPETAVTIETKGAVKVYNDGGAASFSVTEILA